MAPIGPNHAGHLKRINSLLTILFAGKAIVSIQDPLQLGDVSEPEPDLMLLKPNPDFYSSRHPVADDVLLLIEIADSSLNFDQTKNYTCTLLTYHRILAVNLNDSCLEVYRKPKGDVYAEKTTLYSDDNVTLSQLPELTIQVADIL